MRQGIFRMGDMSGEPQYGRRIEGVVLSGFLLWEPA